MICRMLWAPSCNVMVVAQPAYMTAAEFRSFIDGLIAANTAANPDDPAPLIEWEDE